MFESDSVKIQIKAPTVRQAMEQMASAGQQASEAMQGEYVPKAMMDRLNSKFNELYVQVSRLLDLVPDIPLDAYPAEKDVKSDDQWIDGRGGLRAQKVKEVGQVDPPHVRKEIKRETTPRDVTDPPFPAGDEGIEDLRKAIQDGHQVALPEEVLQGLIEKFTEHEDRMEAQGRAIDDLSRRVADQDRKMEERIQRKISSVIASFDEARRMEQEQRAPRHEHVQCSHVPIIFEYVSYEYDDDGNQKVASRSDQFIAGWTCGQDDKPTYGYTYDGKTVEKSVNVCLCGKCKQLFVVVDGVAVM